LTLVFMRVVPIFSSVRSCITAWIASVAIERLETVDVIWLDRIQRLHINYIHYQMYICCIIVRFGVSLSSIKLFRCLELSKIF